MDLQASSQQINILAVIDTEYVKSHYPKPSTDLNNPTGIDHNSEFLIATGTRGIISGQGTADLSFKANSGDYVSFTGTSVYANSDDAVIIYGIKFQSGTNVFNQFVPDYVNRNNAVMPNNTSSNGLPAVSQKICFASFDSKVSGQGAERFLVYFALYTLGSDGETQNLLGYYYWDPQITVS